MYKAELELEKRLNDLALANVPSTSYENIVIVPKKKHEAVLQMSPDEFDLRDLAYDQKMNTISKNAMVDRLGWKPSKIKSDVTKAMIQDYQLEQMKNIKKRLYIPSSLDLDLLEEPVPHVPVDRRKSGYLELSEGSKELTALQKILSTHPDRVQGMKQEWEKQLGDDLARADRVYSNPIRRASAKAVIRRSAEEKLLAELQNAREYEDNIQARYTVLEGNLIELNDILRDNDSTVMEYQRQMSEVQQENARRRKIYEDEVRSLNTGTNFIAMLPNETVDEYKQRLEDIGASTYDTDAVDAAASLLYSDRLREKMVEITRDEVLIGNFIRELNQDQRYSIVKVFDTFKKKVLEIFGQNNEKMSVNDLVQIATPIADYTAIQETLVPPEFKERELPTADVYVVEEGTAVVPRSREYTLSPETSVLGDKRQDALKDYSNGKSTKVSGKLGAEKQKIFDDEKARIDAWRRGEPPPERGIELVKSVPDIRPFLLSTREEIPIGDLQLGVQTLASEIADEEQKDKLLNLLLLGEADLRKTLRVSGLLEAVSARRGTTGRGLHSKYPKIFPFGLIEVSPHKLFYENTLKITRKGKHLTGFPNVKVSDAFVRFMFKIMDNGQPTMKEVNALSAGEKALFDSVVFTAGLSRDVETTGSGVKQDLKNRLALIEGEIEAGNTNPELIKEARKILQHLARMKIIGHRPATEHLKMLIRAQRE